MEIASFYCDEFQNKATNYTYTLRKAIYSSNRELLIVSEFHSGFVLVHKPNAVQTWRWYVTLLSSQRKIRTNVTNINMTGRL
jgi:hypothetical protein